MYDRLGTSPIIVNSFAKNNQRKSLTKMREDVICNQIDTSAFEPLQFWSYMERTILLKDLKF